MIEQGIVALLKATPAIAALIGTRVYPVMVPPDATYPCLSYTTMSKPPDVNMDRSANETKRFQFDCWSSSYGSVKALQSALHALLPGGQ